MLSRNDLIFGLASDLGMMPEHVAAIANTAPLRYKVFHIPKKNGGLREVAQPAREVKAIQRWLMREVGLRLPVHPSATAYRPGTSIFTNASAHRGCRFILKIDFENFFPSILRSDVDNHLQRHLSEHLDPSACRLVAHASCWAPRRQPPLRLCIGAPISPIISNSVMYDFDVELHTRALEDGVTYTRYADDITLSTNSLGVLDYYLPFIEETLNKVAYPRLRLNQRKTVFASSAGRRVVTGLLLTPTDAVSIGRERKRLIRAMYHWSISGRLSEEEQRRLNGLLAFAHSIEPDFVRRLVERTPPG